VQRTVVARTWRCLTLTKSVAKLLPMKVGAQLTVTMLAFLASIGLAYAVVIHPGTTQVFSQDRNAETRIAQRPLNASLTSLAEHGEWQEVRYANSAIDREDLAVTLLNEAAGLRFVMPGFPGAIVAAGRISPPIRTAGAAEFMRRAGGRSWFCRIEPLGTGSRAYLLLAQDCDALLEDHYQPIVTSLLASVCFLLVGAIAIPLLARSYVTRPLAELLRRVSILGGSDVSERTPNGDEVNFVSEEFSRIDEQLGTSNRLLQESERMIRLERRELNAEKLAAIATLVSGFAHEIGTPLGVIRGRAEMLLSSNLEQSEVMEHAEVIITQIDHITRMVNVLLDLGRRRTAIRVASDVRTIADRSLQLLEPEAARRSVAIVANLGSSPMMVDCDPDQLEQVFVNLAVNALDAMARDGGILRVSSVADEVHGKVGLRFEDTGPGVPIAIRDRIFDPFFTTKGSGQGNGMGLAFCQSVIGDHDGELTLEQHDHGACFVVTLPVSRSLELGPRT
jgi:signal transduction histidine kinase